jgi:hypothetical protein
VVFSVGASDALLPVRLLDPAPRYGANGHDRIAGIVTSQSNAHPPKSRRVVVGYLIDEPLAVHYQDGIGVVGRLDVADAALLANLKDYTSDLQERGALNAEERGNEGH